MVPTQRLACVADPRSPVTHLGQQGVPVQPPECAAPGCCRCGRPARDKAVRRRSTYRDEANTCSSLRAAQAAPNPLSMLTVTTPGAQEASALCNAVVPPVATP